MKNRILRIMAAAVLAALGSGCAVVLVGGAAAGAGAYVWTRGELRSTESVPFDPAWDAAQAGLKDMTYNITEQDKGSTEARLTARGAGDTKVQVTLEKVSGTLTEIRIRVGTLGDKALSEQILAKIKSHFPA